MMNALQDLKLRPDFDAREFMCRGQSCSCHGALLVVSELLDVLQAVRDSWKEPITVLSGFRCDSHNASVGGHPRSYHRLGMAADITSSKIVNTLKGRNPDLDLLASSLRGFLGDFYGNLILYPHRNFVHLDV